MFTILANGNPTDATEVNNNFYHVAQGSRLPMGGVSLAATTLAYDLGTTTAYWNNLFVNNIYCNSITTANKSLWTLVSEVNLTATASSIEFTGLNGDTAIEYKIDIVGKSDGSVIISLIINGDSATNYGYQQLYAQNTSINAGRSSLNYLYVGSVADINYDSFSQVILNSKTGNMRMCNCMFNGGCLSTLVYDLTCRSNVWNNTTSTVTSLKFYVTGKYLINGTKIFLWKRG
jgi:hypothetical protein